MTCQRQPTTSIMAMYPYLDVSSPTDNARLGKMVGSGGKMPKNVLNGGLWRPILLKGGLKDLETWNQGFMPSWEDRSRSNTLRTLIWGIFGFLSLSNCVTCGNGFKGNTLQKARWRKAEPLILFYHYHLPFSVKATNFYRCKGCLSLPSETTDRMRGCPLM